MNMKLTEKYADCAPKKSIKDTILEAVERKLKAYQQNHEENKHFRFVIGWWDIADTQLTFYNYGEHDAMAGEGYHEEINRIMQEEGFKVLETCRCGMWRAYTTYTF